MNDVCTIRLMLRRRLWRIDRRVNGAGEAAGGSGRRSLAFLTSRDEVGQTTKACSLTLHLMTAPVPLPLEADRDAAGKEVVMSVRAIDKEERAPV